MDYTLAEGNQPAYYRPLASWAAAKAEVRKLEPKPKQRGQSKQIKTRKEPGSCANQPDAGADKTLATSAGTVKKLQLVLILPMTHSNYLLKLLKLHRKQKVRPKAC